MTDHKIIQNETGWTHYGYRVVGLICIALSILHSVGVSYPH